MSNIKKYHGLLRHLGFGTMLFTASVVDKIISFDSPDTMFGGYRETLRLYAGLPIHSYGDEYLDVDSFSNRWYVLKEKYLNDNAAEIAARMGETPSLISLHAICTIELIAFDQDVVPIDVCLESVGLEIKVAEKSLEDLLDRQTELILKKYDVFDKDIKDKVRTLFKAGLTDVAVRVCQKHHNCDHAAATEHASDYVFN